MPDLGSEHFVHAGYGPDIIIRMKNKNYLFLALLWLKFIPDPGGTKAPDPGSGSATLCNIYM
jgi:hypothetical protein